MTRLNFCIVFAAACAFVIVQASPNPLSDLTDAEPEVVAKLRNLTGYFDDDPLILPEPAEFMIAGVQYEALVYKTGLTNNNHKVILEYELRRHSGHIPQGAKAVITISGIKGQPMCAISPVSGTTTPFFANLKKQNASLNPKAFQNAFLALLQQVKGHACKTIQDILQDTKIF